MKKWFIAAIVTILIGGCSTLQTQVGYDTECDFKAYSGFAVVYVNKDDNRDLQRNIVSKTLKRYIEQKGYTNVEKSKADFYFTVHLSVQTKSEVETNYESMRIRPRYNYEYWNNPLIDANLSTYPYNQDMRVTTSTYEYEEGKLVIEVIDAKKQEVVWQAVAKDEIAAQYTNEEMNAYISEVIAELFKDFPSR